MRILVTLLLSISSPDGVKTDTVHFGNDFAACNAIALQLSDALRRQGISGSVECSVSVQIISVRGTSV